MIVVAIAVVTGGAMLATTVAARITNPLSELNTAAEAVALGDYSRRVHATRRDEIGRLGRTFNAMAGQLATSEASYRLLFQSTPHAMWVYDVDTLRFLDVNDMAIAQYGYSCDEFLAMTIKDIRPPSAVPQLLENISQTSEAVGLSGVWTHRKKDGTLIEVEISSHAIVLHGHRARSVIAHDVTERLKAQQALRQSEELFRGMAETMPQIVWTARPDGWRDYYNRQWFEYTGSTLEEAQGWGWAAALHPDDRLRTVALWRTAIETGAAGYEISHRIKRATDGQYRWHIGRAAPLRNEAGQIVLWVGTNTDVDDAKRADDELQSLNAELEQRVQIRTAQLEEANHELESFSYSVSHDLRAPLRHVQGYVEMLTAAARAQLSEKSLRYLKTISDATVEMGQLIDDLLAFSRIARVQMYEGAVPLDGLIEDVIQGLEMATKGRHIIWKIAALPTAVGDRAMLKQVYANLVGNAVKYTRQRDPAEIEIGCAGEQDGRCVLFVRDNGAGFDMQYAHKLFGVFQRLHRAEEFEGTGIGLATVRRIVVRHGGTAWAEGKLNEGATVYFTLEVTTACSQIADQQR
jgi:PAS domain S-box-containing protein